MIDIQDVAPVDPSKLYRYEVCNEDGTGTGTYMYLKYAPGELVATPTEINRDLLMSLQGFEVKTTVFNSDGSITETGDTGEMVTVFNEDGSIVETFTNLAGLSISKKTSFNADGSIEEVLL